MTLADLVRRRPEEEPVPEQSVYVGEVRVILQCTLTRTAVVRSCPDDGTRHLVTLDTITADGDLRWRPKDKFKRQHLQAANRGRRNAHVRASE